MAKSSKEYRGEPLAELAGKKHFTCECCQLKLSIVSLDVHHKISQSEIVDNSRENLALLCTGCHTAVHRIATSMAGISKSKRPALEVAEEYALSVNRNQFAFVAKCLIDFAVLIAQGIAKKKSKQIEGTDVDTVLSLPPRQNALFKHLARTVKDAKGKPLGKERLLQVFVAGGLMTHYPDLRLEMAEWMNADVLKHPPTPKQAPIFMQATRS